LARAGSDDRPFADQGAKLVPDSRANETDEVSAIYPDVRKIAPSDLREALSKGIADFRAMPSHLFFLALIYPIVGIGLAVAAFSVSVVSFPLLLDRDVEVPVAIFTSLKVVLKNPFTMALWGLIVALCLLTGTLLLFAGLAVVIPVLGHATWHLYRRTVEPPAG
jgi:uncharacterized membrane protein